MLSFSNLSLRRSSQLLFEAVSFQLSHGQKLGITGANGCGKSSLFALITGELSADQGDFSLSRDWVLATVAQETPLDERPAIEYVIDGDQELRRVESRLVEAQQREDASEIAICHERLQEIDGYQAESRAARLLSGLGFEPREIACPLNTFSGGWIMRLKLARALMCRSDLLLLDEPTNHLDLDAVIWLEQWLRRYPGTLMLISHDRDFLDNVVEQIAHIENQGIQVYRGNYSAFERQRAERLALQQAAYRKQQQSIAHMQRYIDRFRAKATKARQAQSRIKALERLQLIAPAHVDSPFRFEFRDPGRLPTSLLKLEQAGTGYDGPRVLEKLDVSIFPGQRIGLLGLNGAGKSTFIKLLADELPALDGSLVRSPDLRIGYFAQHQVEQLDPEASALLSLQRLAPEQSEREIRGYLGGFNFQGEKTLSPVRTFSGGERARLVLALIIWQKPNLLLLDEPTNHLDLEMRLALNQALQGFGGSVILVSHDRHLLRSVCDELWLIDAGRMRDFEDDLDAYPAWLSGRKSRVESAPRRLPETDLRELRRELKSGTARLARLEKEMGRLSERGEAVDAQLGAPELYRDDQREALLDAQIERARIQERQQSLEAEWLELGERVETLQQLID